MRFGLKPALVRVCAAVCLCAAAASAQDTRSWFEVRSPNFIVITDGTEAHGRETALRFEQMRLVFGSLFGREQVNVPVPLQIIAFRDAEGFRAVAPLWQGKPVDAAGLFLPGDDLNFIAVDISTSHGWQAVSHEYAHMLLDGNLRGEQLWFDEGFAQYYSSIRILPQDVFIGEPPEWIPPFLKKARRMPLLELFKVRQDSRPYNEGELRSAFYAQSWLVVHYLISSQRFKQVAVYFELLDQGVDLNTALRRAFGMDARQLEAAVESHFRSRKLALQRYAAPPGLEEFEISARPLSVADAKAAIADLHLHMTDYHAQAIDEFQEVLRLEPNHPAANRSLGYAFLRQGKFSEAGEHFRRASLADSNDPRVHYYSALLINMVALNSGQPPEDPVEMKRQLNAAITLDPDFSDAWNLLAYASMATEDLPGAIEAMSRAVQLSPRNERYAQFLAGYYMEARRWDHASDILNRLKNSSDPQIAAAAQQRLVQIAKVREREPLPLTERDYALLPETDAGSVVAVGSRHRSTGAGTEMRPIKYLKGKLLRVACPAGPAATLSIVAKSQTWKMRVPDRKKLLLIGADAFSCGWRDRNVLVNYRTAGHLNGELISLELQ